MINSWFNRLRRSAPALPPAQAEALASWRRLEPADLDRPHFETRYVVVNTEASGLDLSRDRLLAVAALAVHEETIHPRHSYYAQLGEHPAAALLGLLAFIGKSPVVMYNQGFNQQLLDDALDEHLGVRLEQAVLDLQWLLPTLYPERGKPYMRLAEWMQAFGIEPFQRNHGLGDGLAIAQLLLAVLAVADSHGRISPRQLGDLERAERRLHRAG